MASDLKKQYELDRLYDELPTLACKGECHSSCGPIAMTDVENRRITKRTGIPPATLVEENDQGMITDVKCSLLRPDNTCAVYAIRPMICRLWGIVDALKCPWGCKPDPDWIGYREGQLFLLSAEEIDCDGDPVELANIARTRQKIVSMTDEEIAQVSALFTVPPVKT